MLFVFLLFISLHFAIYLAFLIVVYVHYIYKELDIKLFILPSYSFNRQSKSSRILIILEQNLLFKELLYVNASRSTTFYKNQCTFLRGHLPSGVRLKATLVRTYPMSKPASRTDTMAKPTKTQ